MSQTLATIHNLVAEEGRNILVQQARMDCQLVDMRPPDEERYSPPLARKRTEKPIQVKSEPKRVFSVQTKVGGHRSVGMNVSGGTRRAGSTVDVFRGTTEPKLLEFELEIGILEAETAQGGEGIDYAGEQLMTLGSQIGAHVDRAILGSQLEAPAAQALAAATSFTVTSNAGYLEGETYDHYDDGVYIQSFVVTRIDFPTSFGGVWTINVETALTANIETDDEIYQQGAGTAALRVANLNDVVTSSTQMYGLTTSQFPSGLSLSLTSWDVISARQLSDMIAGQSGEAPTHIVTNRRGITQILGASIDQRRFMDGKMDPWSGLVPMFDDMPIVQCEQASHSTVNFINAKRCEVRQAWAPKFNSGIGAGEFGKGSLIVSEDKLSYKGLGTMGFEFIVDRRRAFGQLTGVGTA
jgi:hypothetical protein